MKIMEYEELINTDSIGILVREFKVDFSRRLSIKLREKGYDNFTMPALHILGIIMREDGIRLTGIAEKLPISKQSIKEIIDFLEERNYLKREKDPDDLRAKKVFLTSLGKKLSKDGKLASKEIKKEYINIIGENNYKDLESSIKKIILDGYKK